jgi:hypothetical protein
MAITILTPNIDIAIASKYSSNSIAKHLDDDEDECSNRICYLEKNCASLFIFGFSTNNNVTTTRVYGENKLK